MNLLILILTPILSFIGSYIAPRRTAKEQDIWRKREETYRMLRFAIELTERNNVTSKLKGISLLQELLNSEILQKNDLKMIRGSLEILKKFN